MNEHLPTRPFRLLSGLIMLQVLLSSCATPPAAPSMLVLPGSNSGFDQFQKDDWNCRQFATARLNGVTPDQAAATSGLASAAVGTALGAAVGAAFGGGEGAAVGAGTGLLTGSMVGVGVGASSGQGQQSRYDNEYIQCMYSRGHKVPVYGQIQQGSVSAGPPPAPPGGTQSNYRYPAPPPPPPGAPPPPPPSLR